MKKEELFQLHIDPIREDLLRKVKKNWDQHSKPIDGFGDFEDAICRIAAIMGEEVPQIHRRALVVMIADNGVIQEQVSQVGAEVTLGVARNLGDGISTASVLAKGSHTDVFPIDIGIASDEKIPGVICRKVARGTKNLRREAAMTEEQVLQAISVGIQTVFELKEKGYTILATGEMGIGNTTTSAALLCALTGCDPKAVTGRGAGLSDEGLLRKRQVVEDGVNSYQRQASHLPAFSPEGTLFALSRLGGLDIAGLTGVFIGGALYHVPIIIDGLISAVSALCAERFCSGCKDYMLASHSGREGGCEMARKELGLTSYLTGNMALGEGTGALLLFPLLDNILYYYTHGSMFEATKIRAYERFDEAEERT